VAELARDGPVVVAGDAARALADRLEPHGAVVATVEEPLAAAVAHAARHPSAVAVAPHALRPLYVRRPDAVLARERAGQRPAAFVARVPVAISRATADDLAAVSALQHRTFTNPWSPESMRWELEHTDVARLYVAREEGGQIVAYCACWMVFDELHINSLAVDPSHRRQGVARALLSAVFAEAVASGARSATLEVRRSNDAARALYEGLGFAVEAIRRDYYQNPREDALILWHRRLSAG
jgi:ribosomal-protein-alanine N-acetyltransferase